jgi:hypothetical protein
MTCSFETLGNASIQVFERGRPVLITDPWLVGTCYFGSWALDHPMDARQIGNATASEYLWISHGHPDHLHHESLDLMKPGQKVLLPDHYHDEIAVSLRERGFEVTVLPYRQWVRLSPEVEVLCIDNINQDGVLVIRAGGALLLNINDSPIAGEVGFLRGLVRNHPNDRTYLFALCAFDADMFNFVDPDGRSIVGEPEERKPGVVWAVARTAAQLGVKNFCCSSSQHIYVRADTVWANPYRITWPDIQGYWSRPAIRLLEAFFSVDLDSGEITRHHPSQTSDESQITDRCGDDDWADPLTEEDWARVEAFFRRFDMMWDYMDFVAVTVAGETRRFDKPGRPARNPAGLNLFVPRHSLMEAVQWGYIDDLLIGNFMKVNLTNTALYPRFTPIVAKFGGNAKVFTHAQYRRFLWRYYRRNPIGTFQYLWAIEWHHVYEPLLRRGIEAIGLKPLGKRIYRSLIGDPVSR